MKTNLVLFSTGLALTMATQLRLENYPVGLGEGLLVAWAWLSWVHIIRCNNIRMIVDLRPFSLFFVALLAMLLLSLLYQIARSGDLIDSALRDLVAYTFMAVLVLTFSLLGPSRDYLKKSLKILVIGLSLSLAVLLIISKFTPVLGPIRLDTGWRFLGLARNPNQIGMAMVPIPFLCLLFVREATTGLGRFGYASILALALWVGISTATDALWLAWLVGALLLALVVLTTKVAGRVHPALTVANVFGICILGVLIMMATPLGSWVFERLASGDGGGHRMDVWSQAFAGILESPIFGRGPGAQNLVANVGASREAHNSYLDIGLAAGLIGLGAAICLTASLLLRPSLVAHPLLWSAFMAMQCFVMFHYMFRHPLFWFYAILMSSFAYQDYETRLRSRPGPALGQAELRLRRT